MPAMLDEMKHVENVEPLCPWCDEPLSGRTNGGLHEHCAEELAQYFEDYDDANV